MKHYYIVLLLIFFSCQLFDKESKSKEINGCMDSTATNYNPDATIDDGSCDFCGDSSSVVMITYDSGVNWVMKCINKNIEWINDISIVDSNNIWLCTEPGLSKQSIILYTGNEGYTWEEQYNNYSNNCYLNYIKFFDENNGIVFSDGKYEQYIPRTLTTTDGGKTWKESTNSEQIGITVDMWRRVSFVDANTGFFFASYPNVHSKLFKTIDGGNSWYDSNYPDYAHALGFYNEEIGIIIDYPGIYRTIDGCNTWQEVALDTIGWGQDVEFNSNDPSQVWIAYPFVYFSSDTGRTWQIQDSGNIGNYIDSDYIRADDIYVGDNIVWALDPLYFNRKDGILYYSIIGTNEWNHLYVPIPEGFNASGVIDGVGDQVIVIPGRLY